LLVVGGAIAVVAVIAAIAFTVGGGGDLGAPPASDDGELGEITLPTGDSSTSVAVSAPGSSAPTPAPTSVAPTLPATTPVPTTPPPTPAPTTVAPTSAPTTVAPTTVVPTTVAPAAPGATTTVPPTGAVTIDSIVPNIAASRRHLGTPQEVQATIDQLLQSGGRHDVAIPGRVDTLCATVQLAGPIELAGRWEFEGDVIDETGVVVLRSAPGFGDCLDNDGGPLEQGSYQYIATDVDGTDSAAATFYVGGVRIDQQFVNNGEEPVCAVFVAPSTSDYFEDFVFASPLPPSASVLIPIADVPQDVEVLGCLGQNDDRVLSDFEFNPTRGEPQVLFP
jgi:hypothetical protein